MVAKSENKHERFLRLAQRRLACAKEKLRLVSQLSSSQNYENTPEEAKEIVAILDEDVRRIAEVFGVEYATRIGKGASQTTGGAQPIHIFKKVSVLDEIEIVRTLEHLRGGRIEEVDKILRSAVTGKRAA